MNRGAVRELIIAESLSVTFALVLCFGLPAVLLPLLRAQTVTVQTLSESDRLLLDTTQVLGAVVGACDKLSLAQKYMAQRQLVTAYIEKQYGQTVDWAVIPAVLKAKVQ